MNAHPSCTTFADELTDLIARLASFGELASAGRNSPSSQVSSPTKKRGMFETKKQCRVTAVPVRNSSTACPRSIRKLCLRDVTRPTEVEVDEPGALNRSSSAELDTRTKTTVVVSYEGRLCEVTVLTPETLREQDWRQPSDSVFSWAHVSSLSKVFRPVSSPQEFDGMARYLASRSASEIESYHDAYLEYLVAPSAKLGRVKEANKLRQALRATPVWTELKVRVRPVPRTSSERASSYLPPGTYSPRNLARVRILDNAIRRIRNEAAPTAPVTLFRPPHSPKPDRKKADSPAAPRQTTGNRA
jgi:hypothetical protein